MAVRFPKEGNEYWPLPPDYPSLDGNGQRLARLNACFLQQTPEDYVAAWSFFRSHYLFPPATPVGMFYRHGVQPSPPSHYQVTHDQIAYQLCAFAAPRSFAKSTLLREWNLLELLTKAHWEIIIFLAKDQFVSEQISLYKALLETNARIIDDFGWYWRKTVGVESLRPKRGTGMWSNHQIQLTTGSMVTGLSITGRALGKRPHVIRFDDVEKDDSLVKEPSDRIEAFCNMLLNVVYPMAEEGCRITVIGTLLSRRSFLYWMMKTADVRIEDHWHRTLLAVQMDGKDLWREKMGPEWQERQKAAMGVTAYRAQYMNDPGTEADRVLRIHDDLCTYSIDTPDQASVDSPLNSVAVFLPPVAGPRGGRLRRPSDPEADHPSVGSFDRPYVPFRYGGLGPDHLGHLGLQWHPRHGPGEHPGVPGHAVVPGVVAGQVSAARASAPHLPPGHEMAGPRGGGRGVRSLHGTLRTAAGRPPRPVWSRNSTARCPSPPVPPLFGEGGPDQGFGVAFRPV